MSVLLVSGSSGSSSSTGAAHWLAPATNGPSCPKLDPLLLALEGDVGGGVAAWEAKTPSASSAADVCPDGTLLIVAFNDGALTWLDARTGKEVRRRASSATGAAVSLRFSPSESRIAAGGADGMVRLLDADSGEELLVLEGHAAPVVTLAFSPDGRRLATAAATVMLGGTIVVWDGRPVGDWPPLPAPDAAWHKVRLAVAAGSGVHFGLPAKDAIAMRYHLNRLAALEPNDLQWQRSLLALDQDAGDYSAAASRLDDIVRRWPDDAPMWYDLGNARRELGNVCRAEAAFRKCIALDPAMAQAQCNLDLLLGRDGRFAEAVDFLSRGHELGMALRKAGKQWVYPFADWLARHKRLGDLRCESLHPSTFTRCCA